MAWKVELSAQVDRELGKLNPQQSKRILKFLHERIAPLDNPRSITGSSARSKTTGSSFWFFASDIAEKFTADPTGCHSLRIRDCGF